MRHDASSGLEILRKGIGMVCSPRCSDLIWSGLGLTVIMLSAIFCCVSRPAVVCPLQDAQCKLACTVRVQLPNTTCTYLSTCDP